MEHLAWLTLKSVPGIGNLLFKRLIDRFETPERVFKASVRELSEVNGISSGMAARLRKHKTPDHVISDFETTLRNNCRILCMNDDGYPEMLREIPDPPPVLYIYGQLPDKPHIAIVGSRNATRYGIKNAERIAGELVAVGGCVVSGLARGVDTAAHNGALNKNGPTVAVLGSGLGNIYPFENRELAYKIALDGAVISEFPYMSPPEAKNFPQRNRIISGLSAGTLVVEAAQKSGSLITARLAAEQNREVFALPGDVSSFKSAGTHSLLKQGARLVEGANDIIEELGYIFQSACFEAGESTENENEKSKKIKKNKLGLDFDEMSVIDVLDLYPVHIDEILQKLTIDSGKLSGVLLKLELMGIVKQSTGKMFSLNED